MARGYQFIFWSPRMLCILGMAFAAVFLVQFFKFPYDSVYTSLVSAGKLAYYGSSANHTYRSQESNRADISNLTVDGRNSSGESLSVALPSAFSPLNPASPANVEPISPVISVHSGMSSKEKMPLKNSSGEGMSEAVPAVSISWLNELLLESRSSPNSKPPLVFSTVDEEQIYAKSKIENAPLVHPNSGLYKPLYHNISQFKRSYELMDKMLRVYIYREGEKPIFHESILEGIYASEEWFLKLLESNKQFVTEESAQPHLFYLPFSSRQLQLKLYVPHSHSRTNLLEYMKNYVEMLVQKHPFWNRTNGEDHFLAACHDWAPAETRGLMLSCLRALCNADIKAGFAIGKDVSLPTVHVQSAKDPLRGIGGEPASKRPILAFFAGYMHGSVRPTLLRHWGKDPEMRIVGRLPHVKGDKNKKGNSSCHPFHVL